MGRMVSRMPNNDPARLQRVLDAKNRTIGIDDAALARQVAEKLHRKALAEQKDRELEEYAAAYCSAASAAQATANQKLKDATKQVRDFQATCQGKWTTKEWDINRPDSLRLSVPARVDNTDPRLNHESCMQRFSGEDLTGAAKVREQQGQSRQWWQEDVQRHETARLQQQEASRRLAQEVKKLDAIQLQAARQEQLLWKQKSIDTNAYNKVLASNAAAAAASRAEQVAAANAADIWTHVNSGLQLENPACSAGPAHAPHRVRRDRWKGMSAAQKKAIAHVREKQVVSKDQELQCGLVVRRAHQAEQKNMALECLRNALQAEAATRKLALEHAAALKAQVEEKQKRDSNLNRLYTNPPKPAYFAQFGTSHR